MQRSPMVGPAASRGRCFSRERADGGGRARGRRRVAARGLLGCLGLLLGCTGTGGRPADEPERLDVILVVLDTVAASHLAIYGYDRVTTPEIDALARRGTLYRNAWSVAPWTLPTHASMLTGMHPVVHGATQEHLRLEARFQTAAELLRGQGYRTFAAVHNAVLAPETGIDQGFGTYLAMWDETVAGAYEDRGGHPTNAALDAFLASLEPGERYFAFLNYTEAHAPYRPPRRYAERFLDGERAVKRAKALRAGWSRYYMGEAELGEGEHEALRGLYDGTLAWLSETIEDLLDGLEARGRLDRTLVILTSDHGENLGDHGHVDHVFNVYETVLRVPLILVGAGVEEGGVRTAPSTSVDVFDTILAATGAPDPRGGGRGRDLRGGDDPALAGAPVVASYDYPRQVLSVLVERGRGYEDRFDELAPYLRRLRSIRADGWKLIWGSDGRHELYHLAADPGETRDLAGADPDRVRSMEARLYSHLSALAGRAIHPADDRVGRLTPLGFEPVDPGTRRQLEALGYMATEP